ncbi:DUF6216 family protein [Dechloromonas denitrificans]|uniref:DUF6216 family protein n=1 Tax=Dechloromonas denitrificans TaxID=281362 RepID=UPI001CFAE3AF|nr:DUF6216 family protein [Dechloromonas denitrificans]UCV07962.1 hypothetical protein KI615_00025 [Dechloromonas denitrificans]
MDQISSFIGSPIFSALAGPLLVIMMIIFFWYRTGTTHSLLERLWRLSAGKVEVGDTHLGKFIKETRDLERFRFMYGLKVGNTEDLHKLLAWLKKHSIDIDLAQRGKKWIDIKTPEIIVLPSQGYVTRQCLAVILYGTLAIGASSLSSSQLALLQMKATGTWFLSDAKSVKPLIGNWVIDSEICKGQPTEAPRGTGFSEDETTVVCKALETSGLNEIVKSATHQQQLFGLGFASGLLVLLLFGLVHLGSVKAARKIHKQAHKDAN